MRGVYTIPAGEPFLKRFTSVLLDGSIISGDDFVASRIMLPTRRACRSMQQIVYELNEGRSLIMPRLQPIGDVDEEELLLSQYGLEMAAIDAPPSMPKLQRLMILAKLVMARKDFTQGYDMALSMASSLAHLIDQIYTEDLDIADMKGLVPDNYADHWQITLEFLKIISENWPNILQQYGFMDDAQRRSMLMNMLADFWQKNPVEEPVIVAGVSGSIPASASVMASVLKMPKGVIALPGLDIWMDDESWAALDETHPQYALKTLLERLNIARSDVQLWPHIGDDRSHYSARNWLAQEMMRPASSSARWAELAHDPQTPQRIDEALSGLSVHVCENERHEASVVALLLRRAIEDEGKTACLITPDRTLAARVSALCKRWGVNLDDSAGLPLKNSALGSFMFLLLYVCEQRFSPSSVLALLQHSYMGCGYSYAEYNYKVSCVNKALRGAKSTPGYDGIVRLVEKNQDIHDDERVIALELLNLVYDLIKPLIELYENNEDSSLEGLLRTHISVCEALADLPDVRGEERLWSGDQGQQASDFFSTLMQHAHNAQSLKARDYSGTLAHFMNGVSLRRTYGVHPRLQILGQLEARMLDADLVILSGLNEGSWPAEVAIDPWMSRPMRKAYGLPALEQAIGFSAHDFVQGFCNINVALTRSMKSGRAPSVPSRWLQRLDAVLKACGKLGLESLYDEEINIWAEKLDHAEQYTPISAPEPRPPVSARPRKVSVTKVETWLKDPYSIYAYYILKLKPLKAIERDVDASLKGEVLHSIFENFVTAYPDKMPDNCNGELNKIAHNVLQDYDDNPVLWGFWWPRFDNIASWYVAKEKSWRAASSVLAIEKHGQFKICGEQGDFIVHGRVDRIDILRDGQAAIIDYKTGQGELTAKALKMGDLPQLPLEAIILKHGGFDGVKPYETSYLGYWIMGGKNSKIIAEEKKVDELLERVEDNLCALIEHFDKEETPYLCMPRPDLTMRYNDYKHLSRVKEWGALDDQDYPDGEAA